MKKVIVGILTLLLILSSFVGCGGEKSAAEESGSVAAASDTAQDQAAAAQDSAGAVPDASDISVTVPDGWEVIDGAALAQYMKGSASFIVTCDTVPADVKDAKEYVEFVKPQFKNSFPDAEFADTRAVTVNGMDGQVLEFTASSSGMMLKYQIVYILKDSSAYTLTCGDLNDDFGNVAAEFQTIIDSFKIL